MIDLGPTSLLVIEPGAPTQTPVIDSLTRRMVAAWRARRDSDEAYCGFHTCACGARSSCFEHYVAANGAWLRTNSLCVHYLAWHRADVPASELAKLAGLPADELDPTPSELL